MTLLAPLALLLLAPLAAAQPLGTVAPPDPATIPFEATATMASDGTWTLVLLPAEPWVEAELSVRGGGSVDLPAADGSAPVEVEGVLDAVDTLHLSLAAVTPDRRGVTWTFEVTPELLPVAAPALVQGEARRRGFWPWARGKR